MSETSGLKILKIKRNDLQNTPIAVGNIIYCTDTKETFIDNANFERNYVENLILLSTELDREKISVSDIDVNKYYLVEETASIYKFKYSWIRQDESIILGGVMITELTPTTMTKDDIGLAPRTLTSCVYMDDGTTLTSALDEIILDGKRFVLKVKTSNLTVQYDNQKIFKIPVPFDNYDYDKFPMIFLRNNVVVSPMLYVVNNTDNQLILSENATPTKKGDVVTFIFNYVSIINETEGIDAESVNGVRYFVGVAEPYNKVKTDVWIDLTNKVIKQFDGNEWNVIVDGKGGSENGGFAVVKNTISVTESVSFVEIGISSYKKNKDLMFVYRNSVYLEENDDYVIDADGIRITPLNGDIWTGTTEEPTVFNFVVLKNVPLNQIGIDGGLIDNGTVTYDKLADDVKEVFNSIFNKFNDYTTTTKLLEMLNNYVTKDTFNTTIAKYVTTVQLETTLTNYATKTDLRNALTAYYTSTQVDNILKNYATKTYVDNNIASTKNTIMNSVNNMINNISLTPGPQGPPGDSNVIVSKHPPSNPRVGLVWIKIP